MSASRECLPRPFGAYALLAKLGQGSQGAVYLAQLRIHGDLGPRFAVKTLAVERGVYGSGRRAALVREGRIGTLVRHPNLVRVVDLGEVDDEPFLAMEFVDGCTAASLARTLGPGAWLDLACQTALGLAALHDAGRAGEIGTALLHLDIKPSNVLVDRTGCVKLADYGLSELMGRSSTQVAEGTPGYMSWEQFLGETVGPRSDLFSLGVTLYNLLAGDRLLRNHPIGDALAALHQLEDRMEDPMLWASVEALVPGVATILERCLRRDATQRYESAYELWAALSRLRPRGAPGPELAELVEAATPGPSRWRPRLPPSRPFVGRMQERTRVRRVAEDRPLTWITGVEGIGKSVLARHALHGATWVPVDDIATPGDFARRTLQALHLSGDADLRRVLPLIPARTVVVDGLDTSAAGLIAALQDWSAAAPDWRWVATTRGRPPDSTRPDDVLELGPLDQTSASDLLVRHAPTLSQAQARALAAQVHRHPVTLEAMGRALAGGALPQAALRLAHQASSTRSTMHWSWSELTVIEQRVLVQILLFRGAFGVADAEALVTDVGEHLGSSIHSLVQRGLLVHSGARLTIPPRARMELEELRSSLLSARQHRALALRHAMHFSQLGSRAALQGLWGPLGAEVLERLVSAREDLQDALEAALVVRAGTTAARCLMALLAIASAGRGAFPPSDELEAVLSHRSLEPEEKVWLLLWTVFAWSEGEEVVVVRRAREAIAIAEALDDRGLVGAAQTALGSILVSTGAHEAAREPIEVALAIALERGDRRAECAALREDGRRLGRMGRFDEAVDRLDEAIRLSRALQMVVRVAWLRTLRALMWARMGRHFDAASTLAEAAEELESNGWWSRAASAWSNVGFALQSRDATVAMHATTRAYRLLLQSGASRSASAASTRLQAASLLVDLGRGDEADAIYDELMEQARAAGSVTRERTIVSVRIGQATILHDWDTLGPLLEEAKRLQLVDRYPGYASLVAYATARHALAGRDEATARAALVALRRECDAGLVENARWMRDEVEGRLAMRQGANAVAEACLERALRYARGADPFGACEVLRALVDVLLENGSKERALRLVDEVTAAIGPQLHPASPGRQRLQAAADRLGAPQPPTVSVSAGSMDDRGLFEQATMLDPRSQ